jgi:hypothetical protein
VQPVDPEVVRPKPLPLVPKAAKVK